MQRLKVLFLSAEVAPFAKSGGLADVCGALPKALAALGHDVRVVMPAYAQVEEAVRTGCYGVRPHEVTLRVPMATGLVSAGVLHACLPRTQVPIYFVAERHQFGDRTYFYGFRDDAHRFAFFSRAALDLAIAALNWRPDVVHAHDWHTAPAVTWLSRSCLCDPRYANLPTVFTIHNLMHQGKASWQVLDYLGVRTPKLHEERPGEVNFMARAIYHATMINTVSPTYAREIMSPEGGYALDALLRYRHFDVHGILNGIDYEVWNPAADRHLTAYFTADSLQQRALNKRALQQRVGLPPSEDVPLVAMVSRLDAQKGVDIAGHVLHRLMNGHAGEAQAVILGSGEPRFENMLRPIAEYHVGRMAAFFTYDPDLAPLIYGGSDIFLMPSLFEPCGLGQLLAMRYGCVPVVRATGGLADTVRHGVTGFTFSHYNADDFWNALCEALYIYRVDRESWQAMQRKGMTTDFSWETSARAYQQLYEWAVARVRGW